MRRIQLLALAILLLGCSKDIKESDYLFSGDTGSKVTFSAVIDNQENANLRATATSWEVGDIIGITCNGKQINVPYEFTGGEGNYFKSVDRTQEIWLMGTEQYDISAYYPHMGDSGTTPEKVAIATTSENQVTEEKRSEIDFLFSSAVADRENPNVQLAFQHVMSRIVLTFKEGEEIESLDNIDCYITGAKLHGVFDPATGAVSVNEDAAVESINQILTKENGHTMVAIVLPQNLTNSGLLIEAGMNGVYYRVDIPYADLAQLKAGYSYNYTIVADKYNDNPIKLTITETEITPWTNQDGGSFNPDPSMAGTEGDITTGGWGDIENEDITPVEK